MRLSIHNMQIRHCTKLVSPILTILFASGCISMGMKMGKTMMETMMPGFTDRVQQINTDQVIDQMIVEAISDLSSKNLDITSIAVWQIKSRIAGIDVEMIRQQIITQLVNSNRHKVVSRQRLEELLSEHRLSLSGTIDESSATEIGQLIGVEGFIDGYASIENERFILSLNLVETKSGVILWANTIERHLD